MLEKDIKVLLKKKKTESQNMVGNGTRISQKMKSKGWFSIEKYINNREKIKICFKYSLIRNSKISFLEKV